MPSKSPAQAKLMRAVAHGWKPTRTEGPPVSVAKEFVEADKKYAGGFAENRYYTGGLAAMNLQEGGDVEGAWTPWGPAGTPVPKDVQQFLDWDLSKAKGAYAKRFRELQDKAREKYYGRSSYDPETTVSQVPREDIGYDPYYGRGPRGGGPRGRRGGGGGRRVPPGPIDLGGVPVPGTEPPVIPPYVPPPPRDRRAGRDTEYSQQLREHKARIADILGSAEGGAVRYQEGGEVRPGHAEGPNPYPVGSARYKLWERKHHRDPAPPPAAEEEESGLLSGLFGRSARELEELEEARGGYVGYQYGGLAQAVNRPRPPMRGRVPPQIRGGMRPGMRRPPMSTGLRLPPGMDPRRSGPKLQAPPIDGGAGIPGGARVPPNMRGFLQKQRMMNRPPPGPVRGGQNRVGQQDQQGGLARALQRGTGRPPMSRRSAFPGR